MTGALFATAVIQEIQKLLTPLSRKCAVCHWRLHSGSEVDIILERDGVLYPIEVKLSSRPSRKDTTGIYALRENYLSLTIATGLVIAPCVSFEKLSQDDYAAPWDLV